MYFSSDFTVVENASPQTSREVGQPRNQPRTFSVEETCPRLSHEAEEPVISAGNDSALIQVTSGPPSKAVSS